MFCRNELTTELFEKEYIQEWIDTKYRKNVPLVIVWLAIRTIYAVFYIVFDNSVTIDEEKWTVFSGPEYANGTVESCLAKLWTMRTSNQTLIFAIAMYLLAHSIFAISHDVYEWFKVCVMYSKNKTNFKALEQTPQGKKKPVCTYFPVWLGQFVMYLLVISGVTVRIMQYKVDVGMPLLANTLLHVFILGSVIQSVMYFIQLIPKVGKYAVMLRRLGSKYMVYFSILYGITSLGFSLVAHRIVNYGKLTCDPYFRSSWFVTYSTFLLTFAMMDFKVTEAPDEAHHVILFLNHFVFVLLLAMLLNYFVALFTYSVTEFMRVDGVFVALERIMLMNVAEFRLNRMFRGWVAGRERALFHTDHHGNLYVTRTVFAKKPSIITKYP